MGIHLKVCLKTFDGEIGFCFIRGTKSTAVFFVQTLKQYEVVIFPQGPISFKLWTSWLWDGTIKALTSRPWLPLTWKAVWYCTSSKLSQRNKWKLGSANVFYCTFTKQQRVQKIQSTDIFSFVLEGVYANFISQLQQTVPLTNKGKGQERSWRGYNQTFIKPLCLLANCNILPEKLRKTRKSMTFLADDMGAKKERRKRESAHFGLSHLPSQPANTLCASLFLLFCHYNKRVQQ